MNINQVERFTSIEKQILELLTRNLSKGDICDLLSIPFIMRNTIFDKLKDKMFLRSNTPHESLCNFAKSYFNPKNIET